MSHSLVQSTIKKIIISSSLKKSFIISNMINIKKKFLIKKYQMVQQINRKQSIIKIITTCWQMEASVMDFINQIRIKMMITI